MKHKKLIISVLVIFIIIAIITMFVVLKNKPQNMNFEDIKGQLGNARQDEGNNQSTTLTQNTEISSAEVEEIELHAGYYLEEVYVEENQNVQEGENILKYTNGTYLMAPYDSSITELNLPDLEGKCLNSHYIQIESTNILSVSMSIDEEYIEKISIGTEATIKVNATSQTYTGYVTHIDSTASNGKFAIDIEFENDGNVKLGMTGSVSISL